MTPSAGVKVLVTGAGGFLGAWSLAALLDYGFDPVALDISEDRTRLKQLIGAAAAAAVPWIAGDIADPQLVERTVGDLAPAAIVHLAAMTIPACRADPFTGTRVNMLGHVNVLEVARRASGTRVIYLGSAAAKPRGPDRMPANLYGIHKRAGEEMARLFAKDFGVASVGLRPFIVYGVGRDTGETAAITHAMRAAALGEHYDMPFTGASCFQFAGEVGEIVARLAGIAFEGATVADTSTRVEHVDDVIAAIKAVSPGADVRPSNRTRPPPEEAFDDRPLRRLIGDWQQVALVEGVRRTIEAFKRLDAQGLLARERALQ